MKNSTMGKQEQFLLLEFQELQARYRQLVDDTVWLQRYVLIFSGAVWAWIFSDSTKSPQNLAVWAPFVITILFSLKAIILHYYAQRIHRYLHRVEEWMELDDLGWSTSQSKMGFANWLLVFWLVVTIVNLSLALIYPHLKT
ncbi:MAG: hypothetical protein OI74_09255 [Gammaproteobacteria bacterium (ex Lamellibrachia satsuma)]|nr:MAG: hypothetical protein HPY30_14140 [Gammaproteobacteria bacterium (ex Lamellibrachia satsuma)]RRS33055.1 MAG: hypothetical protein OI74_09255 [Gammaproteobacteria bacterium (ex Lamellibrachia satsuma)]RRS36894.1 MAG: hypothetical protein NV67_04435 [Gammaproteobacteria bacterium (ex Lamellibrachia satsuma)]